MGLTSFYGEAPWEAKVIAVIGCIKDPRVRCQCRVNLNGYRPSCVTNDLMRVNLKSAIGIKGEKLVQN